MKFYIGVTDDPRLHFLASSIRKEYENSKKYYAPKLLLDFEDHVQWLVRVSDYRRDGYTANCGL